VHKQEWGSEMGDYTFIKGYRENDESREGFNNLASDTFGINFEKWYELGFWTDKYVPYSYLAAGKVVSNVSVNHIELVIDGERRKAIQLGTVMTHPEFRGRGLSGRLMKLVLEDYQAADMIYLFASKTVLDYYPKFGFRPVEERQPILQLAERGDGVSLKKLDGNRREDIDFIYDLAKRRVPVSRKFSGNDTAELLMFYCTYVFPNNIYYWPEEEMVLLMKRDDEILHVFDVVSLKEIDMEVLAARLAPAEVKEVHFHFTVQSYSDGFVTARFQGDEVLFVKTAAGLVLPEDFKHPVTSQA
jgi:GNAT superfamily N-acetyltransferase